MFRISIFKMAGSIFILLILLLGCSRKVEFKNGKIVGVNNMQALNKISAFNFTIMSDNKGDSPGSSEQFSNMVKWMKGSDAKFVIGLGDHLKKGWDNDFLEFLRNNKWWKNHFYPNIADGENEFYGEDQGDWGSGREFFEVIDFVSYPEVEIRENGCEYYAKIKVEDYIIHLIQLHYSDNPPEDSLAFRDDSKQYLVDILESITKGEKDIVIAAAHSRIGFWIDQLDPKQKRTVMKKCDLVLSATTHFFERKIIKEFGNKGPLFINTGSITYPAKYCPPGYVQVNVIKAPLSLIVQYINAKTKKAELQFSNYAFIKVVNGNILETDFRPIRPSENPERSLGHLQAEISKEEMGKIAEEIYLNFTKADMAFVQVRAGLGIGDVKYKTLWDVFPYNNEIYVLELTPEQVETIFEIPTSNQPEDEISVAINNYNGEYLINKLSLDNDKITKTGKREVELLQEWLQKENKLPSRD